MSSPPRNEAWGARLAFAGPAAVAFAFELDQAAEAEQGRELFGLFEGAEHAGEIAGGGDLRADTLAEWFAAGVAAQVVVAARAGRLRDELQLARARAQCHHGLVERFEVEAFAVTPSGLEVVEAVLQPGDVVLAHRGGDVHPLRELGSAVDHAGEGADHDEA